MAVSFIGGGNRTTQRKPPICHKSLTISNQAIIQKSVSSILVFKAMTEIFLFIFFFRKRKADKTNKYIDISKICIYFHFQVFPKHRVGIELTPLPYIPRGRIERYLGHYNFFFIRETSSLREVSIK